MIRVLVNGAKGKMGKEAVKAIGQEGDLLCVAEGTVHDDLAKLIQAAKPDVVVDFTAAQTVFENTKIIIESGVSPVIGTSGLLPEQIDALKKEAADKNVSGLIVPNFSIGAVLMMRFAIEARQHFDAVEVVEMHHDQKRDAPSGTAIRTAELVNGLSGSRVQQGEEVLEHARGAEFHGVNIHSIRLPGLVAHQMVMFGGDGETLTLKHDSINRQCFMPGMLLACRRASQVGELMVGLEHVL